MITIRNNVGKKLTFESVAAFRKCFKVLFLSLQHEPFNVMVTGEKDFECREPTKFIIDRLMDKLGNAKEYDYVLFTNGYGYHLPWFICEFEGFGTGYDNSYKFSTGFTMASKKENYRIFLGEIIHKQNIK